MKTPGDAGRFFMAFALVTAVRLVKRLAARDTESRAPKVRHKFAHTESTCSNPRSNTSTAQAAKLKVRVQQPSARALAWAPHT